MRRWTIATWLLAAGLTGYAQTEWVDPSPHQQRLVSIGPDTTLEVLDWGGSGRTLVLLAQLGQTAHIYDDWAPTLTGTHRVLGITRRGYGHSTVGGNYSAEELATDIVKVLDAENVRDPLLVGNGFAGEEMSWIAGRSPNRVAGLIYLNAAYDRTDVASEGAIARRIPRRSPPGPSDMESVAALTRWASNGRGFQYPEAEFRQLAQVAPDGRVIGERTPAGIGQQILAGMVKPDYSAIRVPVLAIYARPVSARAFPGCDAPSDDAVRQACQELYVWTLRQLGASEKMVETIPAKNWIVELHGADAFMFLSNPTEVRRAMDAFVATLGR
jgi:non-heme chloroperoxidase